MEDNEWRLQNEVDPEAIPGSRKKGCKKTVDSGVRIEVSVKKRSTKAVNKDAIRSKDSVKISSSKNLDDRCSKGSNNGNNVNVGSSAKACKNSVIDREGHGVAIDAEVNGQHSINNTQNMRRNREDKHEQKRGKMENEVFIGTWNVRGLYEEGLIKQLNNECKKFGFDVVALQETKLKGNGTLELEDYILFKSGEENRYLGTGFLVSKKLKSAVVDFKPLSDRMCYLRLRGRYQKVSLINIHAPSEDKNIDTKEEYYGRLDREYDKIPRYDMKIILGDANAKIGREEVYQTVIGKFSKHEKTTENGKLLIDFSKEKELIIKSTDFQRKDIHKGTWRSPDGAHVNQIDHILVEKGQQKSIKNIRSYRGPNIDSDHFVVGMKMKLMIPVTKNRRHQRSHKGIVRLKKQDEKETFGNKMEKELKDARETENIESNWESLKSAIELCSRACETIQVKEKKIWFDNECMKEVQNKNKARLNLLQNETDQTKAEYRRCRKACKKLIRGKKREHQEALICNMEENFKNKEIRALYAGLRTEKKGFVPKPIFCKSKEGKLLADEDEILERWQQYFDELLNENSRRENGNAFNEEEIERDPLPQEDLPNLQEVTEIISQLKQNKSPGKDGIAAEIFKNGGKLLIQKMHSLIKDIWIQEKMPKDWSEAILCPILKKGDATNCENYRGIALLNTAYKILAGTVKNRLSEKMNEIVGEYQAGFRKNRGVADQIFVLKEMQAESYEHQLETHAIFIDFKQAYDRVKRKEMYKALEELGIDQKLVNMVILTMKYTENAVKVGGKVSKSFQVKDGLRQGDPLSAVVFNFVLEKVIRDAKINRSGLLYHKKHQCLAYADDIVIVCRSKTELQDVLKRLEKAAQKLGLKINEQKTKYMNWSDRQFQRGKKFTVKTEEGRKYTFEEVDRFKYLGVVIERNPGNDEEIQARLMAGNKCIHALKRVFNSKTTSRSLKIRIYKTVVRPIVTFASELWILRQTDIKLIEVWERKMLRKIFGAKKIENAWERRTNQELKDLFKEPCIAGVIRAQRIRWMGHVMRLPYSRATRQILQSKIGGKKRRGRPKDRWKNEVEDDIRKLNVANWKGKTADKKVWRKIVHQAMSLYGL